MGLKKVKLENFTAFDHLELDLSLGINVFIGENGTGKTHLMKVMYATCMEPNVKGPDFLRFENNLLDIFLPSGLDPKRMLRNPEKKTEYPVTVFADQDKGIKLDLKGESVIVASRLPITSRAIYIPVKEMLANAPGFRSEYELRSLKFEKIYYDILTYAYREPLREGKLSDDLKALRGRIGALIGGTIIYKGEEFFLVSGKGELEFTLLAEGYRKLGLLWLLINNGSIAKDSVLFWDEPEANLNPKLIWETIGILLELQRLGTQIFIATHSYFVLKIMDHLMTQTDSVTFHSLYRDETGSIKCSQTGSYASIEHNAINETSDRIYDAEIKRYMETVK